ncbi:hypothetical protein As57867_006221, partial [Aphanomyces stellatus]
GKPGGFAKTTFIINGGLECGVNPPNKDSEKVRIASFKKFCDLLGVAPGDNLSCQTSDFPPKSAYFTDSGNTTSADSTVPTKGQCGGANYDGPTECADDALCVKINDAFSECVLKSAL